MGSRAWRVLVALVAALSLVAAACGDDDDDDATGGTEEPADAGDEAQTLPVQVDGKPDDVGTTLLSYFPNTVQARPGDTVEFISSFTGVPHTVTLGSVVDDVFRVVQESGWDPEGEEPPPAEVEEAFGKLPMWFPEGPPPEGAPPGPPPLNQGGAQACYLDTEDPPIAEPCSDEQQQQPAFSGTDRFYNSGILPEEGSFSVELTEDAQPGDYTVICLLHGPDMTATLTVVEPGTDVPAADEVRQQGQDELDAVLAAAQQESDEIQGITSAAEARAGGLIEGDVFTEVNTFPAEVSVAEGEDVTWDVNGIHTISFNAPESARPLFVVDADGTVGFNPEGAAPSGGPGQEPPTGPPPEEGAPPPEPTLVDAGSWDGSGFLSSGVLDAFRGPVQYRVTFATAGTYEYVCLIHVDMEGTVKVG